MTEPNPEPPADLPRPAREGSSADVLKRIRSVVMLAGQIRPSPLGVAVGRSVLDLPLLDGQTLLNHWMADVESMSASVGMAPAPVRLMLSRPDDKPVSVQPAWRSVLSVEQDASNYRGTGGVLADLARDYADDDYILVANAMQLLLEPLSALAFALEHKRADVALVGHADGTPGGLMLIRCAALRKIPDVGYVDMKEQALPAIARQFDVRVLQCRRPTGLPLRTPNDYIAALRQLHRGAGRLPGSRRGSIDPVSEIQARGFAVVESAASVDTGVYLHDAVVLGGARVEGGAMLVRSLVAPGGTVRRDARVIDQTVARHAAA